MLNLKKNTKFINWYPPYLGAGIAIKEVNKDYTSITVEMKMRWWNRNLVGTHFGGSMYSMCDPFFMFILIQNLGNDFIVWDKAATINFKKPGKGTIKATFTISAEEIEQIRKQVTTDGKGLFTFTTQITNTTNEVVAEVEKILYVRIKNKEK